MNTDIESDCEGLMKNHKSIQQQRLGQSLMSTTPKNSIIEKDYSATMKSNTMQKKADNGNWFQQQIF